MLACCKCCARDIIRRSTDWENSACMASAMRIMYTMRIASVISLADVSHNGLFIGLWTEAEVSLGFVVACSLCLPKLIQVKGKKLRNSLSRLTPPFSSLSSKSRKSSLWSGSRKSTGQNSHTSQHMRDVDEERPTHYEEREEQRRKSHVRLQGESPHDIYALPTLSGSS